MGWAARVGYKGSSQLNPGTPINNLAWDSSIGSAVRKDRVVRSKKLRKLVKKLLRKKREHEQRTAAGESPDWKPPTLQSM